MDSRNATREYRLARWSEIISDQRQSGCSIKAYCERNGIASNSFFYWQKKLREAASNQMTGYGSSAAMKDDEKPHFSEVRLTAASEWSLSTALESNLGEVKLELRNVVITANAAYPATQIVELLKGIGIKC